MVQEESYAVPRELRLHTWLRRVGEGRAPWGSPESVPVPSTRVFFGAKRNSYFDSVPETSLKIRTIELSRLHPYR